MRTLFRVFDTDNDNLIDVLEALVGVALVSLMTLEEVAQFTHRLFDFDDSDSLSYDELTMVLRTISSAACKIDPACKDAPVSVLEEVATAVFQYSRKSQREGRTETNTNTEDYLEGEVTANDLSSFLKLSREKMKAGYVEEPEVMSEGVARGSVEAKEWHRALEQQKLCMARVVKFLEYWTTEVMQQGGLAPTDPWTDPEFPPKATSLYLDPVRTLARRCCLVLMFSAHILQHSHDLFFCVFFVLLTHFFICVQRRDHHLVCLPQNQSGGFVLLNLRKVVLASLLAPG